MTITPSRALPVHSAVMSRIGINLVEGKAARERTGHRPRVLKCYFSLSNIFYSHLSCVQNSHYTTATATTTTTTRDICFSVRLNVGD